MEINQITQTILNCAFKVHTKLGSGLLEKVYRQCLAHEIRKAGLSVQEEKPMPVIYKTIKLDAGYKIDLFVENQIVIELKAIDSFHDIHIAQTLTYMKLTNTNLGLLLNFNVPMLKNGIKRLVL